MKTKFFVTIAVIFCILFLVQKISAQNKKYHLFLIDGEKVWVEENYLNKKHDTLDLNIKVSSDLLNKFKNEIDFFSKNEKLKSIPVSFLKKEKVEWVSFTKLKVKEIYNGKLIRKESGEIKFIKEKNTVEKTEKNLFYIFNLSSILLLLMSSSIFIFKKYKYIIDVMFFVVAAIFAAATIAAAAAAATIAAAIAAAIAAIAAIAALDDIYNIKESKNFNVFIIISIILSILSAALMYF